VVRPTVHGNDAAKEPGGVHTITAADDPRPQAWCEIAEGCPRGSRLSANVGLTETPQTNPELMLKTKSVWSPINQKADGLRILVTRFRGRGMPTSRYNVWMPSLGPSERLLKAGQAGRIS